MICTRRKHATISSNSRVGVEFVDGTASKIVGTPRSTLSIAALRGESDLNPAGNGTTAVGTKDGAVPAAAVERTSHQGNGGGVAEFQQESSIYQRSVKDEDATTSCEQANGGDPPWGAIRIHGLSSASRRLRHRKNVDVPGSIVILEPRK